MTKWLAALVTTTATLFLTLAFAQERWTTVSIKGIGTIDIPPTMEIQSGKYKEYVDSVKNVKGYESVDLVIQPKGVNYLEGESLAKYVILTPFCRQGEKPVSSEEGELAWRRSARHLIGSSRSML